MPKYEVFVVRSLYASKTVEAKDEEEAEAMVMDIPFDQLDDCGSSEDITEINEL